MAFNNTILGEETDPGTTPSQDEKLLGLLAHLITFISSFIGPLIIYLLKKDESPFVAAHAKESLNFQITVALFSLILIISIIGIFLIWAVGILAFVLVIVAAVRAFEGKNYRYPVCLRLIK